LFKLPRVFFDFSLELAGGFLLADVAFEVFLASGGTVTQLLLVPFRDIPDFEFPCLLQRRGVGVALLFLALCKLCLFALAIGVALSAPRGREKVLDEARDAGLRLLQVAAAALGFSLVSVQCVETVEFLSGVDVEGVAKLAELRRVGFDKPARLLFVASGDGFSEGFGLSLPLSLNRVGGEFRRFGGGFGRGRGFGLLQ
jgi:hypothetical protein